MNLSYSDLYPKKPNYYSQPFQESFNKSKKNIDYPQSFNGVNIGTYDEIKNNKLYCGGDPLPSIKGMQIENSPLSELYFSKENVNRIQKNIKKEVFKRTNGKFKLDVEQDESDMLIVMRAVFLNNANFFPTNIVGQVKQLNKETIDYAVPDLITNIEQHYNYVKTINQPLQIMDNPLNVSHKGRRTLPSVTTTFQ